MVVNVIVAILIILCAALVGVCAGLGALAFREVKKLTAEVTELQAAVDVLMLATNNRPWFAERFGIEYVLDPTKLPPPEGAGDE